MKPMLYNQWLDKKDMRENKLEAIRKRSPRRSYMHEESQYLGSDFDEDEDDEIKLTRSELNNLERRLRLAAFPKDTNGRIMHNVSLGTPVQKSRSVESVWSDDTDTGVNLESGQGF